MQIDSFITTFKNNSNKTAIIWNRKEYTYKWIIDQYNDWILYLKEKKIPNNSAIALVSDFSPRTISLLLALIKKRSIIVPLSETSVLNHDKYLSIGQVETKIRVSENNKIFIESLKNKANNKLYKKLKDNNQPGLVLFSSGSTGESKASVHNLNSLLEKYSNSSKILKTITFLLFDHIGGFNTLFYILSNAGTAVTVKKRKPKNILKLIEKYEVELLPTSPTFLNLVLISEEYKNYNLESLKIISYGTEPMPKSILEKLNLLFPNIIFKQTYGLSEVGILPTKSKKSDSLWLKIGGKDVKTRIINDMLEVKSKTAMLGYLNSPSPFTQSGWFKTGDKVLKKGSYIKILGRESEIINVGGEKVYPQEVENVILKIKEVKDVTIYSEKNLIMGSIICATISCDINSKDLKKFERKIKIFCADKLERYKIPIKYNFKNDIVISKRFKKNRY